MGVDSPRPRVAAMIGGTSSDYWKLGSEVSSTLGTALPWRSVAWFWFAVFALPAAYLGWGAFTGTQPWLLPAALASIAFLIFLEPRLRKQARETVQVDENGVLRVDGPVREQIKWDEVVEIRIITTDEGPFREDVFFALVGSNGKGCLVPHDAAARTKLLEELQVRFAGLDNETVIKAMGSTSNDNFLVWKKFLGTAA